jgi:acetolactate synthase-1/2/3 large subunit
MTAHAHAQVVSTALADGLSRAGVRRLFGMPGGGPNLDMIGAAAERGIDFVLAHGETAASVMAGAFGLLTGTTGVALVTRGPGLTSAANGLAQATLDRSPLLLLSDCVPAASRGRTGHQRLDQLAAAAPLTVWNGTLGHRDPSATVAASAALAAGPPSGAVHLDYDPGVAGDWPPAPATRCPIDHAALRHAVEVAGGARRPVLVLGSGAPRHAGRLRDILERAEIPVLTTYQALGCVDTHVPWCAGLFTNAALERPLLSQADLIIGVGLDGVEPVPAEWAYQAPVVLLTDIEIDGSYYGRPEIVPGPPETTLPALLAATDPVWPADAGARHRDAQLAALGAGAEQDEVGPGGLHPVDLVRCLRELFGDAQVTVDAGAHMLAAMPFWPARRPHQVLISNGLATMGYALPSAIGAALARPEEPVLCLVGDGGLGMTLAELETLARLGLPVTVVVFNDAALSLIEIKQRAGQGDSSAVRFAPVDFAGVAGAMGIPAARVDNIAGVRAALAGAGSRPLLLDARIDPAGYSRLLQISRG